MSRQDNTVTWWDPDLASSRLNYSRCHDAREIYPRLCNLGIIWGIWCLLSISSRRFIDTPLPLGTYAIFDCSVNILGATRFPAFKARIRMCDDSGCLLVSRSQGKDQNRRFIRIDTGFPFPRLRQIVLV